MPNHAVTPAVIAPATMSARVERTSSGATYPGMAASGAAPPACMPGTAATSALGGARKHEKSREERGGGDES